MERSRDFFQTFQTPAPRLTRPLRTPFSVGRCGILAPVVRTASWHMMAKNMIIDLLDRQQAAQLVELSGLRANSFLPSCSVGPISSHDNLELADSHLTTQDLAAVFANVARACPVLELLTWKLTTERDTWCGEETIRCSRTRHHVSRRSA